MTAGTMTSMKLGDTIRLSGNLEGVKTVKLGFMVKGRISDIPLKEGQRVGKGQVVAQMDPVNYRIAKDIADASVAQVRDEYTRIDAMHKKGSVAEADYVKVKNGLAEAEATRRLHLQNLKETTVYSPISGVLIKKIFEEGEIVDAGIPVVVVSDISRINVNAFVPEDELHSLRIGQEVAVRVDAVDETVSGEITEIGALADGLSRSFPVKIKVPNEAMKLRPGMIADVRVASGQSADVRMLPAAAVQKDGQGVTFVYVVDVRSSQAFKRRVITGHVSGSMIEITGGVAPEEQVVTGGWQKLVDGMNVKVENI